MANLSVTPQEKASLAISQLFYDSGTGYMLEQGTKPGTIALALGTNPVALLSWYASSSRHSIFPCITSFMTNTYQDRRCLV